MIHQIAFKVDKKGKVLNPPSAYRPDDAEKHRIQQILQDFTLGWQILNKPYREFNDLSLVQRMRTDQKSFNIWTPAKSNDPDDKWKSDAVRPVVRNKVIGIAAHITAALIFPQVFAQNENDEEDKDAATVMRDLMEWVSEQSKYAQTFLYSVISALVNPAAIVHMEFAERMRTIKEIKEDGTWDKKEVLDEVMSGFQDNLVPCDELFIGNVYEHNIQKQPFLIWRRVIDWQTALSKYGDNQKFKDYVRPGLQIKLDANSGQFYDVYDNELQDRLVEEVIYYNRSEDLQLVMVNGVLLTDPEQPNPRNDKRYPFVKFGYELIDEGKFFYYFPLVRKMAKDEELVNTAYRLVFDTGVMNAIPPVAVFGNENINSSVMVPGSVSAFSDKEVKLQPLTPGNATQLMNVLEKVEESIKESSMDLLQSGQEGGGTQTAYEISRLEQNARKMLGLFGKMVGEFVESYGDLKISDILQFLTVGEVMELTGDTTRMKFPTFIMPNRSEEGRTVTRKIQFQNEGLSDELDFEQMKQEDENGMRIYKVNPEIFRERKFKTRVSAEIVSPPSDILSRVLNLEEYDRAIMNPFANQEMLYRDLLLGSYDKTKVDPDKYVQQPVQVEQETTASGSPLGKLLGANNPELKV